MPGAGIRIALAMPTLPIARAVLALPLVLTVLAPPAAGRQATNPHENPHEHAPANPARSAALESIRAQNTLPALAAYGTLWNGDEATPIGPWAVGRRSAASQTPVQPGDLWHIGSNTKAFTATLLATYVAEGKLAWDDTLAEVLPDLAADMTEGAASATIADLLRHRAGLPSDPPVVVMVRLQKEAARAGREGAIVYALANANARPGPGEPGRYSNLGYMVAGVVAERLAARDGGDTSWEELVAERVLTPLGIKEDEFGFGPPPIGDKTEAPQQPVGHAPRRDRSWEPRLPGNLADNPPAYGPAGTLHLTMEAWGRFCMAHARGDDLADGERDALGLSREDYAELHRPVETFAAGWLVARRGWARGADDPEATDGVVLTHNGSNTLWFATVWIAPERDAVLLAATNAATPMASVACDKAVGVVLGEMADAK
jgi:CubicO group peptidase (beta-lactamase class C family)